MTTGRAPWLALGILLIILSAIIADWRLPGDIPLCSETVASIISASASLPAAIMATLALLAVRRRMNWSMKAAYSIGLAGIIVYIVKFVLKHPRPPGFTPPFQKLLSVDYYGYPSGHSVFAGIALYFAARYTNRWIAIIVALWAISVMLSRLAVGAHYPSQVAGGFGLGILIASLVDWALERLKRRVGSSA